jgi:predicted dehydrogenase
MFIQFQKKMYEIPEPIDSASALTIKVERFAIVPIEKDGIRPRFYFSNIVAKTFFFLFHEGLRLTLNKVKTVLLQRKVFSEKKVVFAFGQVKGGNGYAIAVGPQDCLRAEYQTFPVGCTFSVPLDRKIEKDYHTLLAYFRKERSVLESLYQFSPYSGHVVGLNLEKLLEQLHSDAPSIYGDGPVFQSLRIDTVNISPNRHKEVRQNDDNELFLAGVGAYACAYILPALRKIRRHTVIDLNPGLACVVGEKYGFIYRDTSCERGLKRLQDCMHPLLVIATYHSTHLEIAEQALSYNPATKIFMEKPPVTTREQLQRLLKLRKEGAFIEIGYNRRYIPFARKAEDLVSQHKGPITMTCIIKELMIPKTHWYYWPAQGTRITGNLCHWIDLGCYFIKQKPVSMTAVSPPGGLPGDELSLIVLFEDGSRLTLIATDRGNPLRGVQEYIDIRRDDLTITIDDFMRMKVQKGGQERVYRRIIRDKGHLRMYKEFLKNVSLGKEPLYPDDDLYISSTLYLSLTEMVLQGQKNLDIQLT